MKKSSSFQSAFFTLRAVVAVMLCSLGASLALLALAAPSSTVAPGRHDRLGHSGTVAPAPASAADMAAATGVFQPVVSMSLAHGTSPMLRSLPLLKGEVKTPGEQKDMGDVRPGRSVPKDFVDPVAQTVPAAVAAPTPSITFEGMSADDSGCNCIPPDITGAVSSTQYVQMVNSSAVTVYSKTGARLAGPTQFNSMFGALPASSRCRIENAGDPIVEYDQLADRWVLSQFTTAGGAFGYHQCIAVSQTADATGAYYVYDFLVGNSTRFQDYPHFGTWPDGYYMSTHEFNPSSYVGSGVFAFEREKMLLGQPAQMVYFDLALVNSDFFGHLPSDLDGATPPPAGAPNYFAQVDDSSEIGPVDAMRIWKFDVDWTTPLNSTYGLNGQPNFVIPVANFSRPNCLVRTAGPNCVPQPASPYILDTLGDRLMYRLAYRNFGTHESLVANHTVVSNGTTQQVAPRWYEVRNLSTTPTIHQQGTLPATGSDDLLYRWMGSIAMDRVGNMAIGYSTSSQADFPSIAYSGRLATDPLGAMGQGETQMWAGGGSQDPFLFVGVGIGRWGDYSHLAVDPADDCTFWYTTEYYPTPVDPLTVWHTRIGSFKFPNCTAVDPVPVQLTSVVSRKTHGSAGDFDVDLLSPTKVECRSGQPAAGDHKIVFAFEVPVTFATAECGGAAATTSTSGNSVTVNCTGRPNAASTLVVLRGVTAPGFSTADVPATLDLLLGDTTGNRAVNSSDISQTKSQSGQTVTQTNFRQDVTVNAAINSSDISLVKSKSGTALP